MVEKDSRSVRHQRVAFPWRNGRFALTAFFLIAALLAASWRYGVSGRPPVIGKNGDAAPIDIPKSPSTSTTKPVPVQQMASEKNELAPRPVNAEGYVGLEACAACHAERVSEFRETRHFQACVVPPHDNMPAGFLPGQGTFIPHDSPVQFVMSRAGNEFQQTAFQNTPKGERQASSVIALVYGSGAQTDEVYFSWQGDFLSELPMCWLHPINDWGISGFDRDGSGDFARPTTPRCMECHNTWMNHLPGTLNEYKRHQSIYGITCEVCHGPGREHVQHHQTHPGESSAVDVVHPGKLTRERRMDLCAQCHSNALKHRGPAFSYRPGEPLDDHYKTLKTKNPEDDHVANQVSYLRESKCFQNSDQMTCITCHDPHVHQPRSERGVGGSDCKQCHQPSDCGARDQLPIPVQDNCVGCHMPKSEKIQVSFSTREAAYYSPVPRWEHRIAVYPVARDQILLDWYRSQTDQASRTQVELLTKSLFQYWTKRAAQFVTEHRHLAAIHAYRQALQLQSDAEIEERLNEVLKMHQQVDLGRPKVRHLMAEGQYDAGFELAQQLLKLKPNDAVTRGNLGTLFALRGQKDQARQQWRDAAELDPDDPYGPSMLGWQAYLDGDYEEAMKQFLVAESIEPYFDKINYQMGLALLKLQRWPEAIDRFQRVLKINPKHLEGHIGLNSALRKSGQVTEALSIARNAANLSRESNLSILDVLAETYAEAGQFANAERTAHKMIGLAQKQEPQKIPGIRKRLEEWHAAALRPKP